MDFRAVATSSEWQIVDIANPVVAYLFRTIGQVLGVSLSAAIVQAILTTGLQRRITGPDASRVSQVI